MRSEADGLPARRVRVLTLDQGRGVWGAQKYLLRLAPLLSNDGIDLVLANPPQLELHGEWKNAGLETLELDLALTRDIKRAGGVVPARVMRESVRSISTARRIARAVRQEKCDVILANSYLTHLDGALAGKLARVPVILHLHEESAPGLSTRIRRAAVRLASQTVAVSAAVGGPVANAHHRSLMVIPNGVDTEVFRPLADSQSDVRAALRAELGAGPTDVLLIAACRLDPAKRIEDLIAALAEIGRPEVKLAVAGTPSDDKAYADWVIATAAERIGASVKFIGYRDDMATVFGASDVVVHAGVAEGMPLGLLEAQSCGRPVVAYDAAGVSESVVDGVTGLIVPVGDIARLANSIASLVDGAELRAAMGSAGRAHVLRKHSITRQAEQNAEIIRCAVRNAN
ncbi:MAG: glycosyltransferase family 4 protein [Nocardiaceae bacterium]|nr:glycosyltransferase family 4 protein [Nocardiaceae bacterium]